jgi:hypothetical protein
LGPASTSLGSGTGRFRDFSVDDIQSRRDIVNSPGSMGFLQSVDAPRRDNDPKALSIVPFCHTTLNCGKIALFCANGAWSQRRRANMASAFAGGGLRAWGNLPSSATAGPSPGKQWRHLASASDGIPSVHAPWA